MNSANAFALVCSGSMNEGEIQSYSQYVRGDFERISRLGGWFGEQAKKAFSRFNDFVDSRAWELSSRLTGNNYGESVNRFDIGYLGSMEGQQNAIGFMRDYIMANPEVMRLYKDEVLSGYGGEFSVMNQGIGDANPFYRRAMNGVVNVRKENDVTVVSRTHYHEVNENVLPVRSQFEIQRTWRASTHHIAANLFDCTSIENNKMSTAPEEDEE